MKTNTPLHKREFALLLGAAFCVIYFVFSQLPIGQGIHEAFQSGPIYRQVTGFLLFGVFIQQWLPAIFRDMPFYRSLRAKHEWVGCLLPLLLVLHTITLGFGYQTLLVWFFLGTFISGLMHPKRLKLRNLIYFRIWHVLHVSFASSLIPLLLFHLYVVYSYH